MNSPFSRAVSRELSLIARDSPNYSPASAVVSRKNRLKLVAASGCPLGRLAHFAEQYIGQIEPFSAIDVSLQRLKPGLVLLNSSRNPRKISRVHVLKLCLETD